MSGERRSRRGGGSAPPTDEEDEIQKLQAERLAAAAAGPSQQSGGEKYAGYARELADEEPEEDEPVRYVWRVTRSPLLWRSVDRALQSSWRSLCDAAKHSVFLILATHQGRVPHLRDHYTPWRPPPPFSPPPCFAR